MRKRKKVGLPHFVSPQIFVDIHKTIELLNGVLHLFNQIGEIESMIGSNDLSEFLMGYDKLKEAITFLEQNSGGVGAAEKLEKCKGRLCTQSWF